MQYFYCMFIRYFLLPICIFSAIALSAEEKAIEIFSDYPGGNIIVENIDQATCTANIRQDLRDTSPWWFYWNFKAKNIGGKTVTFKFTNKPKPWNLMETYGPAVSIDGGKTWKWLNPPEPRGRNNASSAVTSTTYKLAKTPHNNVNKRKPQRTFFSFIQLNICSIAPPF